MSDEPPIPSDPDELRHRWADLTNRWSALVERAAALPDGAADERVDGEWSLSETLRHLVFATDAWLRRPVLAEEQPFWPAALPHSECPDREIEPFGIDRDATPSWDEVLAARADRQRRVLDFLGLVTHADLARQCGPGFPPPDLGADSDVLTVGHCVDVILEEEAAHLGYAERDLTVLERRHA